MYLARSAADEPRGIAGVCAAAIAAVDRARAARYALAVNAIRLGVVVWLTDQSMAVTDLARTLEQAGIESLFLTEHTHVPVSRRDVLDNPVHSLDAHLLDSFTALGAAAAVTSRLVLGTGICIIPQHDPIILAKQVATIDHLSAGRFAFGVAAGWLFEEMQNHGVQPSQRWARMTEQILAMKQIWTQQQAEFHGRFVDFDPIWLEPKPVQAPHPPVLIGGDGPRALRVAAECGDGWLPIVVDAASFEQQLTLLKRLLGQAGRPDIEVTACFVEINRELMTRCAQLGVARFAVIAPIQDRDRLQSFLDQYLNTADRIRA
jgi:probable F420-dependent oxidoreductase